MRYLILSSLAIAAALSSTADTPPEQLPDDLPINVEELAKMDEASAEAAKASINPLENDLRALEVALRTHRGFAIQPGNAFFNLGVKDGNGVSRLDEQFTLVETSGISTQLLVDEARADYVFQTYKVDPADYDRMRESDLLLKEMKRTSDGQNQLTFNAGAYACAAPNVETPDAYRMAIFVRSAPTVEFVPLTAGDLIIEKDNAGPFAVAWEPCADQG